VIEVNLAKAGHHFEPLADKPNSVYLPLMATTRATTSQRELPHSLKGYMQIVIDERKADASFVARFLNTPLGLAVRDVARRGVTIPRIGREELLGAPFFLPPLEIQRRIVAAQAELSSLRNALGELESGLWRRPLSIEKQEAEIRNLNKDTRFEDWIESLPFHLASSLWRYHAYKGSPKEAYERLALFFEAVCEFLAVLHLSAFSSNPALWAEIRDELKARLESQALSLDRATFGAWKLCAELLSSRAESLLEESPGMCLELYRTRDRSVLEAICSKHVRRILQEANEIRNSAIGHVGAMSERGADRIHSELWTQLGALREAMGTVWSSYEMVLPRQSKYSEGLFHYDAFRIMGTRSMPFQTMTLRLIEAMEDGQLYAWNPGNDRALAILPLIKIMPSPTTSQNAAYFYNRREGKEVRFLSYHFETDSEIVAVFDDTSRSLEHLFRP